MGSMVSGGGLTLAGGQDGFLLDIVTSGLIFKGEREPGKPSWGRERIQRQPTEKVKQNQKHCLGSDLEEAHLPC